jgi:hypothetical protein
MPFNIGGYIYNGGIVETDSFKDIITRGLTQHLDASDAGSYPETGTTWFDISGNSNDGILTNGPTFNSGNGGYINFDGTNDYVSCTTNITMGTAFSMESFIYINSRTNGDIIGSWNNPFRFLWRVNTSGYQLLAWNGGGPAQETIATSVVSTGVWVYVVVTYDGTNVRFYNNAVLTDTNAKGLSIANFTAMQVGANTYDGVYFNGRIANTRIYTRTLAAAEILQNFNVQRGRFGI